MKSGGLVMQGRALLIGNWKMNKTVEGSAGHARTLIRALEDWWDPKLVQVVLAPTALAIAAVGRILAGTDIAVAGQNLELGTEGALTGGISGYLLYEAGARWVIVGHSERRQHFAEDDALITEKVKAAWQAGLNAVVCIGETEAERNQGATERVVRQQLNLLLAGPLKGGLTIAYEPVWAIGSGRVPEPEEVAEIAAIIHGEVGARWPEAENRVAVLYGGSVNAKNLGGFLNQADVGGALIGGASLAAGEMAAMVRAAQQEGPRAR